MFRCVAVTWGRRRFTRILACALLLSAWPVTGRADGIETARQFLSAGYPDSALVVVDSSLAADSTAVEWWRLRARVFRLQGRESDELAALRSGWSRNSFDPDVNLDLARAYRRRGVTDSIRRHLVYPLRYSPPHKPFVLYELGRLLEAENDLDSAVAVYRAGCDLLRTRSLADIPSDIGEMLEPRTFPVLDGGVEQWRPGRPTVFLTWSRRSDSSLHALEALAAAIPRSSIAWRFVPLNIESRSACDRDEPGVDSVARMLGYDGPVWVDSRYGRLRAWGVTGVPAVIVTRNNGEIELVRNDWADSTRLRLLDGFMGAYTDTLTEPVPLVGRERMTMNWKLGAIRRSWRKGRYRSALESLGKLARDFPAYAEIHLQMGVWRWVRGDTAGARVSIARALKADSLNPWALFARGRIALVEGRTRDALRDFRRAIDRRPRTAGFWASAGVAAARIADWDFAGVAAAELRELDPENPAIAEIRAWMTDRNDRKETVQAWREALRQTLRDHPLDGVR